jgi:hypothetical protein
MTEKKREPWDGLPHGWLKDELAKRTVKAKVTDPEERKAIYDNLGSGLKGLVGPGGTIPRYGRYGRRPY